MQRPGQGSAGGAENRHTVKEMKAAWQTNGADQRSALRYMLLDRTAVHGDDVSLESLGFGNISKSQERVRAVFLTRILLDNLLFRIVDVPVGQDARKTRRTARVVPALLDHLDVTLRKVSIAALERSFVGTRRQRAAPLHDNDGR